MNIKAVGFLLCVALSGTTGVLVGKTISIPSAAVAMPSGDPTCASSGPCIEYQNTSSGGQGIEGVDNSGIGVLGATHSASGVKGTSTSGFGVYGEAGTGIGVKGTTAGTGTNSFGIIGYAGTAARDASPGPAAVQGSSDPDNAIAGYSDDADGLFARSNLSNGVVGQTYNASTYATPAYGVWGEDLGTGFYNIGVYGTSSQAAGVVGTTENPSLTTGWSGYGVKGEDLSTDGGPNNFGVLGTSTSGTAINGVSTNGVGVEAYGIVGVYGICNGSSATDEFEGGSTIYGNNFNVNCHGTVGGALRTRNGMYATTTMPRSTTPIIEDYGQAQLVNGRASVALDPAFAQTISASQPYLVFVTPDGDTNGLYVTGKTMQDFEVREVRGGTSSLAFDYRIVARPANDATPRMTLVRSLPQGARLHRSPARPAPIGTNGKRT